MYICAYIHGFVHPECFSTYKEISEHSDQQWNTSIRNSIKKL